MRGTFTPGDAAMFESLAVDGVTLSAGADDVVRTRAVRETLLAGATPGLSGGAQPRDDPAIVEPVAC